MKRERKSNLEKRKNLEEHNENGKNNIKNDINEDSELFKKELNSHLLFWMVPIIFLFFMVVFLDIIIGVFYTLKIKPVIFTIFLLYLINTFLTLLTGSQKRSAIIQSTFLMALLIINKFRFIYTTEPFTFADMAYVFNLSSIVRYSKRLYWYNYFKIFTNFYNIYYYFSSVCFYN